MILNHKEEKMQFDNIDNTNGINSEESKKPFTMEFDLPKEQSSIIKVVGVGGGGSNAVNHMFRKGIHGVNFIICNTDAQALEMSAIPNKIQLGPESTEGLGAGSDPNVGRMATEESLNEIKEILEKNTKMVFVTAGMGGGTGTGGAPVIAKLAKDMGLLTVAIVTKPFFFEGSRKVRQAKNGIEELRQNVDSIIVISNDKIRDIYGNLTQDDAFGRVDDIVAIGAKSISEIITLSGTINVDFADVQYVMKNSGTAIMGSSVAEGEDRALKAIQGALESPLLDENNIQGAQKILLNITSGSKQVLVDEIEEINAYIMQHVGGDTDVIFGTARDESLGDAISVTVIATGFSSEEVSGIIENEQNKRRVYSLGDNQSKNTNQTSNSAPKPEEKKEDHFTPGFSQDQLRETVQEDKTPEITRHNLFDVEEDSKDEVAENAGNTFEFNFEIENSVEEETEEDSNDEVSMADRFQFDMHSNQLDQTEEVESDYTETPENKDVQDDDFFVIRKKEKQSVGEGEQYIDEEDRMKDIDRMREMKNLRKHYNDPSKLRDMEDVPAWQRKNIQLHNVPSSQDPEISRYNLMDYDEDRPQIRRNNSFLHDKAD